MFKDIDKWSQKKLKSSLLGWNLLYFAITFLAPIIICIVYGLNNDLLGNVWKISFSILIPLVVIIFALLHYFKKSVQKIKILNIDGSYNNKNKFLKHFLLSLSGLILPATFICLTLGVINFLRDGLIQYLFMIVYIVICVAVGNLIQNAIIVNFDEEMILRDKVAEQNAITMRTGLR